MTEKSEALWLADRLEHGRGDDVIYAKPAAAELRRLHAVESKYNELLFAVERYLCFSKPLDNDPVQPLFTHPPRREWRSLSEEERADILFPLTAAGASDMECARAIEQALKEKNQ